MALTDKLSAIGVAIRSKTGGTELLTLDQMPTAIESISSGGGGGLPEEALTISGECQYRFGYDGWNWFLEEYGDQITTNNITSCNYMFCYTDHISSIPFDINTTRLLFNNAFNQCAKLTSVPKVNLITTIAPNSSNINFTYIFANCYYLRDANNFLSPDDLSFLSDYKVTSAYSWPSCDRIFSSCFSLRTVPDWYKQLRMSEESTTYPSVYYTPYSYTFSSCYSLDEITDLQVLRCAGAQTSNMFSSTFSNCTRLKNMTFETQADGTPYTVSWKAQTIDLSSYVGYASGIANIVQQNSGITKDKQVTDDATYQALKNDPDWFTTNIAYSRYNHDSAVATINSLPDTSAYLATAGGTNTIKFKGASGSATDGGAINTLTEEEIAVATAKGWTVSLV